MMRLYDDGGTTGTDFSGPAENAIGRHGGFVAKLRFVAAVCSIGMVLPAAGVVYGQATSPGSGQAYPNKPIRIITSEAGGGGDFASRVIAQGLTGSLGQQVIVDNRTIIAADIVAKAPPDGYTLLSYGSTFWISPLLRTAAWDPVRDFSPIALTARSPNVLVVFPSLPANSVKELIALAQARPGTFNYPSAATGSASHLAAELFKAMAGVNIVRVPYKGTGAALTDLIAGQVHVMFATSGTVTPHIKSGRLRALAVTSAEKTELLPALPTISATLPGYEAVVAFGVFAPATTPATLIRRLNQAITQVLNRADVKERFLSSGVETAGGPPERLAIAMKSEMLRMGKLIKDAAIREE